jgi:hypothetical protein
VLHILLSLATGTIGPFEAAVEINSAPSYLQPSH